MPLAQHQGSLRPAHHVPAGTSSGAGGAVHDDADLSAVRAVSMKATAPPL